MRYLLDTHVIIWMVEDSPNLPIVIRDTQAMKDFPSLRA